MKKRGEEREIFMMSHKLKSQTDLSYFDFSLPNFNSFLELIKTGLLLHIFHYLCEFKKLGRGGE